jgi:hypothetical protein
VYGKPGTGKTTGGVGRVLGLLARGVPAHTIAICVPQPSLGAPYREALRDAEMGVSTEVNIWTLGGLTRRMVALYWPMVAEAAGFSAKREPVFLNSEQALWVMARAIEPLTTQAGFLETVRIPRVRVFGQILDDMNKAALVGFDVGEIGERLKRAWDGDRAYLKMYDDVQSAAHLFRGYCLAHGLLDYSMTLDMFMRHVWPLEACRGYVRARAVHVVYDNVEEDVPAAHRVWGDVVAASESAVVLFDEEAGYRRFLGADEVSARRLSGLCDEVMEMEALPALGTDFGPLLAHLRGGFRQDWGEGRPEVDLGRGVPLEVVSVRFYPDMLDKAAERVAGWVHDEGIAPSQIAVMGAYVPDALQFALTYRLTELGVPNYAIRPSRPLKYEGVAHCLVTLAYLAHPQWGIYPTVEQVAQMLTVCIEGLDPLRAGLLAATYRQTLTSFHHLLDTMQARVTVEYGLRYERLRVWLEGYRQRLPLPLDVFWGRLYSEILSQRGFGFRGDVNAGHLTAEMMESAGGYLVLERALNPDEVGDGRYGVAYLEGVSQGVLGQRRWSDEGERAEGVLIAPAYTFLMMNRTVARQLWLDIGSGGWTERLSQPLAHPYVLNANWDVDRVWTSVDEIATSMESGYRLTAGLVRRCSGSIVMMSSDYSEAGMQQQGLLLNVMRRFVHGSGMGKVS